MKENWRTLGVLENPERTIDWFFFFWELYKFWVGRNLRNHLVQFLHFMDRMTLYPILRYVSQIMIHILEIWNFGRANRKNIRYLFRTFCRRGNFERELKNLNLNCSESMSVVYELCCILESLITRPYPILIKSQCVGWSQVSAVKFSDLQVIPVWSWK